MRLSIRALISIVPVFTIAIPYGMRAVTIAAAMRALLLASLAIFLSGPTYATTINFDEFQHHELVSDPVAGRVGENIGKTALVNQGKLADRLSVATVRPLAGPSGP